MQRPIQNIQSPASHRPTASGPNRSLCRALGALVLGEFRGEDPHKIVAAAWPTDSVAEIYTRAVISPTSTGTAGVADLLASGFGVLNVAPKSASAQLFSR